MAHGSDIAIGLSMIPAAFSLLYKLGIDNPYDVLVLLPTLLYVRDVDVDVYKLIDDILEDDILLDSSPLSHRQLETALYELDHIGFIHDNMTRVHDSLRIYSKYAVVDYTYIKPYHRIVYHIQEK